MNIQENRLYLSSELADEVHIADGISAIIFDEENILRKVTFGFWASLKYFSYFSKTPLNLPLSREEENTPLNKGSWPKDGGVYTKHFLLGSEESRCEVYSLLSSRWENIEAKIHGEVAASKSFLDMNIVSFVSDNGLIDLDGIINIRENIAGVEGYLVEENIFLGSSGKVRGLPTLLVHSNDVKASHACNMEKISDEKLFYLRSRGLPKQDATLLMLESYIYKIFWGLEEYNEALYKELQAKVLEKIRHK